MTRNVFFPFRRRHGVDVEPIAAFGVVGVAPCAPADAAVDEDEAWRAAWTSRPLGRGRLHAVAAFAAPPAAALLVRAARPGRNRGAAAVYGSTLCALFAVSGAYHRLSRTRREAAVLRRVDHSTIYVFIAGTWTAIAVSVLPAQLARRVLAAVWVSAAAAAAAKVRHLDDAHHASSWFYPVLGGSAVVLLRAVHRAGGSVAAGSVAAGGAVYLAGAAVFASGRPDPWPHRFGYHEIFHTAVVAGAGLQYVAIWRLARSAVR